MTYLLFILTIYFLLYIPFCLRLTRPRPTQERSLKQVLAATFLAILPFIDMTVLVPKLIVDCSDGWIGFDEEIEKDLQAGITIIESGNTSACINECVRLLSKHGAPFVDVIPEQRIDDTVYRYARKASRIEHVSKGEGVVTKYYISKMQESTGTMSYRRVTRIHNASTGHEIARKEEFFTFVSVLLLPMHSGMAPVEEFTCESIGKRPSKLPSGKLL